MRHKYHFIDSVDEIENETLKRDSYYRFISEVIELNKEYNYSIYLFGSYIGYLIEKIPYNDIDFIITSEKILDTNELTKFFKLFHKICKKYNIGYNLMYSVDKKPEDFDTDLYSGYIFKGGFGKLIRLYEKIDTGKPNISSFTPLPGTELFEGTPSIIREKLIKKMQMGVKFYTPIKIQ